MKCPKSTCQLKAESHDRVILMTMKATPNMPSIGACAVKVEAFLRYHKIPYKREDCCNTDASPTKQLPFIYHKGEAIAESHQILDYLTKTFDIKADGFLSPEERAIHNAMMRMLEEHYEDYHNILTFSDDSSFTRAKEVLFKSWGVPRFLWGIIGWMLRMHLQNQWKRKGPGRYPTSLISSETHKDFDAFADFLGEKRFLMGERLTTVDMVALGTFGLDFFEGIGLEMRARMMERENVARYLIRVRDTLFPEYKDVKDVTKGEIADSEKASLVANAV